MPDLRKPRLHIIVIGGPDFELKKKISIPLEQDDLAKTFRSAYHTLPNMLSCDPKLIVAILGREVYQYAPERFAWLCGAAPDPEGKDPNWMGGK